MSYAHDLIVEHNGTLERKENSTHCCSFWYIPNGTDYHLARAVVAFFDNEEQANKFQRIQSMPPECADIYALTPDSVFNDHFSFEKYGENGILNSGNYC